MVYYSDDEGTVVVTIWVDKTGKVIRAVPGARGTKAPMSLYESAKIAALSMQFTAKPDAQGLQKGTVAFDFILE